MFCVWNFEGSFQTSTKLGIIQCSTYFQSVHPIGSCSSARLEVEETIVPEYAYSALVTVTWLSMSHGSWRSRPPLLLLTSEARYESEYVSVYRHVSVCRHVILILIGCIWADTSDDLHRRCLSGKDPIRCSFGKMSQQIHSWSILVEIAIKAKTKQLWLLRIVDRAIHHARSAGRAQQTTQSFDFQFHFNSDIIYFGIRQDAVSLSE